MSQNQEGRPILGGTESQPAGSSAGQTPLNDPALRSGVTNDANYERGVEFLEQLGFQLICSDDLRSTRVTSGRRASSPLFQDRGALEAGHLRQLLDLLPLAEAFPELVVGSGTGGLPSTGSRWEADGTGIVVLDARESDRGMVITPQGPGALLDVLMGAAAADPLSGALERVLALRWDVRITNSHQPYLQRDVFTLPTYYAPRMRNHPEWEAPLGKSVLLPGVMVPATDNVSSLWRGDRITHWRPACLLNLELLFQGEDPPPPVGYPPPPPPGGNPPEGDDEEGDPYDNIRDYLDDAEVDDLIGLIEDTVAETGAIAQPEGTPIPEEDEDDLEGSDSPQERSTGTPNKGLAQLAQSLLAWAANAGQTMTSTNVTGQILDLVNLVAELTGQFGGTVTCPTAETTKPNVVISEGEPAEDGTRPLTGVTSDGQEVEIRGEETPTPQGAAALQALQNGTGASRVPAWGQPGSAVDLRDQIHLMHLQLDATTKMIQALLVGDASGFSHYAGNLAAISTNQLGMGASKHVLGQHLIDPDDEKEIPEAVKILQAVEGRKKGTTLNRPGFRVERHTKGDVIASQPLIDVKKVTEEGATDSGDYFKGGDFSVKDNGVVKTPATQLTPGQQSTIPEDGYGFAVDSSGDPVFMKAGSEVALGSGGGSGGTSPLFGDGSDGALTVSSDTQISGEKNYSSVTFGGAYHLIGTMGTPTTIRVTGNLTGAANASISASGLGQAGGAGGTGGDAFANTSNEGAASAGANGAAFTVSSWSVFASGGGGGGGSGGAFMISGTGGPIVSGAGGSGSTGGSRTSPTVLSGGFGASGGAGASRSKSSGSGVPDGQPGNDGSAGGAPSAMSNRAAWEAGWSGATRADPSWLAGGVGGGGGGGGGGGIITGTGALAGTSEGLAGAAGSGSLSNIGGHGGDGVAASSTASSSYAVSGGGGGGGGAGGGVLSVYIGGDFDSGDSSFRISANGGDGGAGGNGGSATGTYGAGGGAGGGGAGGAGGVAVVVLGGEDVSGDLDTTRVTASAGSGGAGGSGGQGAGSGDPAYGGDGAAGATSEAGAVSILKGAA